MNIEPTPLPGLVVVQPQVFGDDRGYFLETWNAERYSAAGIREQFVQDNMSLSRRGTVRGLHFQNPGAQGKLVYVVSGEVWDVAVDLRRDSATFGQWYGLSLSGDNKTQMYIPPGFAHGFCVTSESALFAYKCTAPYRPDCEHTLLWNDPALAIPWPVDDALVSAKDRQGLPLREIPDDKLSFNS